MNLQDYPTPETDYFDKRHTKGPLTTVSDYYAMRNHASDHERRLAACREFIQEAIDMGHFEESHIEAAKEILELTKP